MPQYIFTLDILSKAPQVKKSSIKLGKEEIKKADHKIDIQDVIEAVKSQFKIASFPKILESQIEEGVFRQKVTLKIKSLRSLDNWQDITGINESMFSLKVSRLNVK